MDNKYCTCMSKVTGQTQTSVATSVNDAIQYYTSIIQVIYKYLYRLYLYNTIDVTVRYNTCFTVHPHTSLTNSVVQYCTVHALQLQ